MTREEYGEAIQRVLNNAGRLRFDNRETVIVMSMDMYNNALAFERYWNLPNMTAEADTYGIYFGHRIGIVNDSNGGEVENMMEVALIGMTMQDTEVRVGDLLVVSEDTDNHLYQMTTADPVQFTDTGLVVAFDRLHHPTIGVDLAAENTADAAITATDMVRTVRVENGRMYFNDGETYVDMGDLAFTTDGMDNMAADTATVRIGTDTATLTGTTTEVNLDAILAAGVTTADAIDRIADMWNQIGNINTETGGNYWLRTNADPFYYYTSSAGECKKEVKEQEKELEAGDTKLIDDFLNGFAKKEILNPAT